MSDPRRGYVAYLLRLWQVWKGRMPYGGHRWRVRTPANGEALPPYRSCSPTWRQRPAPWTEIRPRPA